jgi:alkylation response protein AidB-like acyl-CoA dehydrogenase
VSLPLSGPTAPSALDPDGVELATVARRWLEARSPVSVVRAALAAEAEGLPPFWDELVDLGWIGLAVPGSAGGQGATPAELAVVLEEWGRAVAPGPFPATAVVATVLGRHAPDLVGPLLAGAPAAVVTDPDAPVDGGGLAEWFLVPVLPVAPGAGEWVLARRDELELEPLRAADGTRRPARVRVDAAALPEERRFRTPPGLVEDLVALARGAEAVGVASWCVHTAAAHAADRVQFGRPIGQFQAVKHRCADALCRLEAARALVWDASRLDPDDAEFPGAVAAAASLAPTAAFACAKDAIQVLGGIGYTWEHDAHLYLRRATALEFLNGGGARWRDRALDAARSGTRRSLTLDLPPEAGPVRERIRVEVAEIAVLDRSEWNTTLADEGWMCPHWPAPWGRDADALEQLVIDEEFRTAGIRRPHLQVAGWVLPTLIAHGTDAQRDRFIGPSLRHEITWCQLFSEPGAGSDLASLSTRAERVDGGWSLTGQKVWTTMAKEAQFGICLARTDPDAPKHEGITCFLVDMATPGIDIRPLRELTGFALFNEVFLDDVFVPDDMVVGAVHDGWRCARTTLENERVAMASGSSFGPGVEAVLELAASSGALEPAHGDDRVRDRVGELVVTAQAIAVMGLRTTLRALGGGGTGPGPEASVRKLVGVEHEQRVQEVGMSLLGPWAAVDEGDGARWFGGFLGNRALSIAGGTSEIQRNVIAERLLGLPRDP